MKAAFISFLVALVLFGGIMGAVLLLLNDSSDVPSSSVPEDAFVFELQSEFVDEGFEIIPSEVSEKLKDSLPRFDEQLSEALDMNFEVRGWLYVPNTNISEPVLLNISKMDSSGELDYDYYLDKNIKRGHAGAYDTSAVIYADVRNKLGSWSELSRNTVIYGHNWTNVEQNSDLKIADPDDKQFSQLPSFSNLEFAQKATYFTLDLANGEQIVCMIFAAMYVDTYNDNNRDGFYYIATDPDDEEFSYIVSEARARSEHLYKVPVGINDKIVTLTTCTLKYGSDENQRFVLMGRVLRPEEDIDDFGEPVKNLYPKRPAV